MTAASTEITRRNHLMSLAKNQTNLKKPLGGFSTGSSENGDINFSKKLNTSQPSIIISSACRLRQFISNPQPSAFRLRHGFSESDFLNNVIVQIP